MCVALLAVGCSSGEADPVDAEPGAAESSSAAAAPLSGERSLGDVQPVDVGTELRQVDTVSKGVSPPGVSLRALFADGRQVLSAKLEDPLSLKPRQMMLKGEAAIPRLPPVKDVAAAVAADGNFVVWLENDVHALAPFPWTMYAYDVRTGKTSLVARSHPVRGAPPPPLPSFSAPSLHDGKVAWIQADSWPKGREVPVFNLYGADLEAGTGPKLLAREAKEPVATTHGVVFARDQQVTQGADDTRAVITEVSWDGKQEKEIATITDPGGAAIQGVAATDEAVGWVQIVGGVEGIGGKGKGSAVLLDRASGSKLTLHNREGGCLSYPELTEAMFVVSDGNCSGRLPYSGYIVFRDSGELRTLGTEPGLYGFTVAGRYLAISSVSDQAGANTTERIYEVP